MVDFCNCPVSGGRVVNIGKSQPAKNRNLSRLISDLSRTGKKKSTEKKSTVWSVRKEKKTFKKI